MIDHSSLNNFTFTRFEVPIVSSVLGSIRKGDVMSSVNVKDTYLRIPVNPEFLPFWIVLNREIF